jgi:hypothetical protein
VEAGRKPADKLTLNDLLGKHLGTWSLFPRRQRQRGEPRLRLKGDVDDASLFGR